MDQKIIEQLPIGVALTTTDGRILRINAAGKEILGLEDDHVATTSVPDLYAHPNEDRFRLWNVALQGRVSRQNIMLRKDDYDVEICVYSRTFGANGFSGLLSAFWLA